MLAILSSILVRHFFLVPCPPFCQQNPFLHCHWSLLAPFLFKNVRHQFHVLFASGHHFLSLFLSFLHHGQHFDLFAPFAPFCPISFCAMTDILFTFLHHCHCFFHVLFVPWSPFCPCSLSTMVAIFLSMSFLSYHRRHFSAFFLQHDRCLVLKIHHGRHFCPRSFLTMATILSSILLNHGRHFVHDPFEQWPTFCPRS